MTPAELTAARNRLGLSKAAMARACGVSWWTWNKWEIGTRQPSAAAVRLVKTLLWLKDVGWIDNFLMRFGRR